MIHKRIDRVEEALNSLSEVLGDDIILNRVSDVNVGVQLKRLTDRYLQGPLDPRSIDLVEALTDVLLQQSKAIEDSGSALKLANSALRREGLFSPKELLKLKEDFSVLNELQIKYVKAMQDVEEHSMLLMQRNIELRLELLSNTKC